MRRTKTVLAVAGLMIAMFVVLAAPAIANDNDRDNNHHKNNDKNNHHNRFFDHDDDHDDDDIRLVFRDDFFDDDFRHNRFFDRDNDFDFDNDFEQDTDSGDVDQSFVVTNTGDNSNQCVGTQGVANTGNAQNQLGFTTFGDGFNNDFDHDRFFFDDDFDDDDFFDRDDRDRFFFRDFDFDDFNDDFEIEDSDASIEVSPTNTTTCDQQVNQAAAASSF
jgi:hypothetical protein